jgi:hypothetical protein
VAPTSLRLSAFTLIAIPGLAFVLGCGGSTTATGGPPPRRGEVWAVEGPDDDASVPGTIVAFVNGLHVVVVDGDRVYAGMNELQAKPGTGSAKVVTFPSGLTADLTPSAQGMELRFSSGERVLAREKGDTP